MWKNLPKFTQVAVVELGFEPRQRDGCTGDTESPTQAASERWVRGLGFVGPTQGGRNHPYTVALKSEIPLG